MNRIKEKDEWIYMKRCKNVWMGKKMDSKMYGQIVNFINIQMDRWMNGLIK